MMNFLTLHVLKVNKIIQKLLKITLFYIFIFISLTNYIYVSFIFIYFVQ